MEQYDKPVKSSLAIASLILGIFSFFPLLGVLLGIIAIILGLISLSQIKKRDLGGKKLAIAGIILGILGIIFTFVFYGSLLYWAFIAETGPFAKMKPQVIQQALTQNAGALELYKKKYGRYPETLKKATETGFIIFPMDNYLKPFYYKVPPDGQSYDLRSLGPDGAYGTEDDIYL